ncbi:acyltransferase family protein [Vibrio sp. TBV020]|uniref:acyltransferase family protein n=1 Tax=Vibrio sp. TBV020 TaxID=3137398 RepID=UPI0038CDB11B
MRVESLTFFRFIAACLVVIFHYGSGTLFKESLGKFGNMGPIMVTFFFTLSGFVLAIAYYKRSTSSLLSFYFARIARIAPIYLLALLLTWLFFDGVGWGPNDSLGLFLNITWLQAWFPSYALSYNAPGWSLSVEMFFYASFPFIFWRLVNLSIKQLITISFVLYIVTQFILSQLLEIQLSNIAISASELPLRELIFYFPLSHYCSFFFGLCSGVIFMRNNKTVNNNLFSLLTFTISTALMIYVLYDGRSLNKLFDITLAYGSSFYSIFFALYIYMVASNSCIITQWLSKRPFVVLGEASYSLYILQMPVYLIMEKFFFDLVGSDLTIRFFLYFCFLLLFSLISWKFFEAPMRTLILRFTNKNSI